MKKYIFKVDNGATLLHYLFEKTGISKQKIKLALNFGAVQVKKHNLKKFKKVRRATFDLTIGDEIIFYYDEKLLSLKPLESALRVYENKDYGIWIKPAGVLSQGTLFADHTSLYRYIEKIKKEVYLIHRLDRETMGLMIFSYNKKSAANYSELISKNKIKKMYQAWVYDPKHILKDEGEVATPLDGKPSKTSFKVIERLENVTLVDIELHTGRIHQIRKHFLELGCPIMGDPLYGKGNKTEKGLQLVAYSLEFDEVGSKRHQVFALNPLEYLANFSKT